MNRRVPIKDFENYLIYDDGRVFNTDINKFKNTWNCHGYKYVALYKKGKRKSFRVHRLVAEHFINNPHNFNSVNHKDENKQNNHFNNLEWCTTKYNTTYSQGMPVIQYTKENVYIKEYPSVMEASRSVNTSWSNILQVCRGKRKTSKKYIWKFKNEGDINNAK